MKPGKLRKHADDLAYAPRCWIEPEQVDTASLWTRRRSTDAQGRGRRAHRRAGRTRGRTARGGRAMNQPESFVEELRWRGLLHQTTATEAQIAKHLSRPGRVAYAGFDPTQGQPHDRQLRPDHAAHALSARRAQADRADGRRHGPDRRSVGQGQRSAAADREQVEANIAASAASSSACSTSPERAERGACWSTTPTGSRSSRSSTCCATSASTSRSTR